MGLETIIGRRRQRRPAHRRGGEAPCPGASLPTPTVCPAMFDVKHGRPLASSRGMTLRTVVVRFTVTVIALVTAVLGLIVALLRLATAGALWAAGAIPARTLRVTAPVAVRAPQPALRLVPAPAVPAGPSAATARLEGALAGLGFKVGDVRRVVAGLGGRVEREPIADLIKTSLRLLAA